MTFAYGHRRGHGYHGPGPRGVMGQSKEMAMKDGMRGRAASALVALAALCAATLAGCAGGSPGHAPGSQASDSSGITVFGTIDANVSHTRSK